jgi:hypothetical protein
MARPTIWTRGNIRAASVNTGNDIEIPDDFAVTGALAVTGAAAVGGALNVTGVLAVTGAATLGSTLAVTGTSTLSKTSTINFLALGGTVTDPVLYGNAQAIVQQNPLTAIPSTARAAAIGIVSNTTGVALVINTGTTVWKYLLTTAIQPT